MTNSGWKYICKFFTAAKKGGWRIDQAFFIVQKAVICVSFRLHIRWQFPGKHLLSPLFHLVSFQESAVLCKDYLQRIFSHIKGTSWSLYFFEILIISSINFLLSAGAFQIKSVYYYFYDIFSFSQKCRAEFHASIVDTLFYNRLCK